jgi:hypothetical protein
MSPAQSGSAMVTTKSMTTTTMVMMMMSSPRRGRGQHRRRRRRRLLHDKNTKNTAVVNAAENTNDETPTTTSGVVEVNETAIHYFTEDAFYDRAEELYSFFQNNHSDAKRTNSERFCWDYWHVENQYTQLRTPAREYFLQQKTTEEECCCYEKFEEALLKYARENLALSNFTPIWMSCYVDGMGQELHADVPHGPLAFVFSLTKNFDLDDDRGRGIYFRGGETTILRPERANYWQRFDPTEIVERTQLFEEIEPKFNRLTIFDPRLPHGVREVKGTKDVSKGRLVLNGWFNEPAISCQGGLTLEDVGKVLDAKLDALYEELENLPAMTGFAALRMEIDADTGNVESISWGCDTVAPAVSLHDPEEITETRDAVLATIAGMMSECVFSSSKTRSSICVPFVFG